MPAYGLIPDSPWITGASKLFKRSARGFQNKGLDLRPRGLQVTMTFGKLIVYKPILNFELNNRLGLVGRSLHGTANRITQLAKLKVGKKTGRLAKSIRFEHIARNALGPGIKVGAYTSYALLHHRGTRPHIITPNKPGGNLVFRKGSRIIHSRIVMHPGTKANRYLTDPMNIIVRARYS